MRTGFKVATPPAVEPVTLAEARLHLRIDTVDDDAIIEELTTAAREWVEDFLGRSLITQQLEQALDDWPRQPSSRGTLLASAPSHLGLDEGPINLWRGPVQSVQSVTYTLEDGTDVVLDDSTYDVDTYLDRILLAPDTSWPSDVLRRGSAIVVRYTAGYGTTPASVPRMYRACIKLLLGHLYVNREAVSDGPTPNELPMGLRRLLGLTRAHAL